jgi:hypothetical protein
MREYDHPAEDSRSVLQSAANHQFGSAVVAVSETHLERVRVVISQCDPERFLGGRSPPRFGLIGHWECHGNLLDQFKLTYMHARI